MTPLEIVERRIEVARQAEAIGAQDANVRLELELVARKIRELEAPETKKAPARR